MEPAELVKHMLEESGEGRRVYCVHCNVDDIGRIALLTMGCLYSMCSPSHLAHLLRRSNFTEKAVDIIYVREQTS